VISGLISLFLLILCDEFLFLHFATSGWSRFYVTMPSSLFPFMFQTRLISEEREKILFAPLLLLAI